MKPWHPTAIPWQFGTRQHLQSPKSWHTLPRCQALKMQLNGDYWWFVVNCGGIVFLPVGKVSEYPAPKNLLFDWVSEISLRGSAARRVSRDVKLKGKASQVLRPTCFHDPPSPSFSWLIDGWFILVRGKLSILDMPWHAHMIPYGSTSCPPQNGWCIAAISSHI